jgi:S1-C subfamily serine protease
VTEEVISKGPAPKAGLQCHDHLLNANGEPAANNQSLRVPVLGDAIGQPLTLTCSGLIPNDVTATPEVLRGDL